jgi:hypothetical protein
MGMGRGNIGGKIKRPPKPLESLLNALKIFYIYYNYLAITASSEAVRVAYDVF